MTSRRNNLSSGDHFLRTFFFYIDYLDSDFPVTFYFWSAAWATTKVSITFWNWANGGFNDDLALP